MKRVILLIKKWVLNAPIYSFLLLLRSVSNVRLSMVPSPANGYVMQYSNKVTRNQYQLFFDLDSAIELHYELERRLHNKEFRALDLTFPEGMFGDNNPIIYVPCWIQKELNRKLKDTFASKFILSMAVEKHNR